MTEIYYIGGSPCSGKSTIAERLAEKYGLQHFRQDDYLEEYIKRGAKAGHDLCKKISEMSNEEMWMRSPKELWEEEITLYEMIFSNTIIDVLALSKTAAIIAEGAGFMPHLVKQLGVDKTHYVCVTPTREFQLDKYAKREWISIHLRGCTDEKKAFENWMERDVLFGEFVTQAAKELGFPYLVVDGTSSIEENFAMVEEIFRVN